MANTVTDVTLMAAIRSGDEAALALLYDRFAAPVYSLALRITGERDAALEVTQDTFLRVWNSAVSFDPQRGTCNAWVFTIARHRALDVLRSRQRRVRTTNDRFTSEGGGVPEPAQSDETERVVLADTVAQALAALPRAQRQAIELAYFGGLTQQQIATQMNEPLGTVKSRMRSALETLRTRLNATHATVTEG